MEVEVETAINLDSLPRECIQCIVSFLYVDAFMYFKRRLALSLVSRQQRRFFMADLPLYQPALFSLFETVCRDGNQFQWTRSPMKRQRAAVQIARLSPDYHTMMMVHKPFDSVLQHVQRYVDGPGWIDVIGSMPTGDHEPIKLELVFITDHFMVLATEDLLGLIVDLEAYVERATSVRDVDIRACVGDDAFNTLYVYEEPSDFDDERCVPYGQGPDWLDVTGFQLLCRVRRLEPTDTLYHLAYAGSDHIDDDEGVYGERENLLTHWCDRVQEMAWLRRRLLRWHTRIRALLNKDSPR